MYIQGQLAAVPLCTYRGLCSFMWEVLSQGTLTPGVPPPQTSTVCSCTQVITWSLDTASALCQCSGRFTQHSGQQHGAADVITKSGVVFLCSHSTLHCAEVHLFQLTGPRKRTVLGEGAERSRRLNKLYCGGQTLLDVLQIVT